MSSEDDPEVVLGLADNLDELSFAAARKGEDTL
jgi:hypothetical protein